MSPLTRSSSIRISADVKPNAAAHAAAGRRCGSAEGVKKTAAVALDPRPPRTRRGRPAARGQSPAGRRRTAPARRFRSCPFAHSGRAVCAMAAASAAAAEATLARSTPRSDAIGSPPASSARAETLACAMAPLLSTRTIGTARPSSVLSKAVATRLRMSIRSAMETARRTCGDRRRRTSSSRGPAQPASTFRMIDRLAIRVDVFMIETPTLSSQPRGCPNSV